jgi:hypothetical protein
MVSEIENKVERRATPIPRTNQKIGPMPASEGTYHKYPSHRAVKQPHICLGGWFINQEKTSKGSLEENLFQFINQHYSLPI